MAKNAKNMLSTQGGTPPLKKHVDAKMLFRAFRAKKKTSLIDKKKKLHSFTH